MSSAKRLDELHIELGNAITAIKVASSLLARIEGASEAQLKQLRIIAANSDRAWELASELMRRSGLELRDAASEAQRILVVDDHDDHREALMLLLEDNGYAPLGAESAESARQVIAKTPPRLMLLDRQLPGQSGEELLRELKAGGAPFPIVVVSGRGGDGLSGADAVLTKPLDIAQLMKLLERFAPREP